MAALKEKIDFALVFTAKNANPNGDPLDGNRPRTTYNVHTMGWEKCQMFA